MSAIQGAGLEGSTVHNIVDVCTFVPTWEHVNACPHMFVLVCTCKKVH